MTEKLKIEDFLTVSDAFNIYKFFVHIFVLTPYKVMIFFGTGIYVFQLKAKTLKFGMDLAHNKRNLLTSL